MAANTSVPSRANTLLNLSLSFKINAYYNSAGKQGATATTESLLHRCCVVYFIVQKGSWKWDRVWEVRGGGMPASQSSGEAAGRQVRAATTHTHTPATRARGGEASRNESLSSGAGVRAWGCRHSCTVLHTSRPPPPRHVTPPTPHLTSPSPTQQLAIGW